MSKFGISQPVRRIEDSRLLTGRGCYIDDMNLDAQIYGYVLRSPLAHARLQSIDVEAARDSPGVLDVITGEELEQAGVNHLPCSIPIENSDGSQRADPKRPILCAEKVCYLGDNVAFVVAETSLQARDAAELVEVDYEELPVVTDTGSADEPGRPRVHDGVDRNVLFDWECGDPAAVECAFAGAAHITHLELVNNRVVVNSMEPRGAIADFDPATEKFTLYTSSQGGWWLKDQLAEHVLGLPPDKLRVVTPDVGGGFGMKGCAYPEHVMLLWATRKLGRPVKWTSDRSEAFVSDSMGRDHVTRASIAFNADHRILAMRVLTRASMGAYLSMFAPSAPTACALKVLPGVYDTQKLHYRVKGITTNTVPIDAYRGAGRPEAIYVIERLMDRAARELGLSPVELRRHNFIPPSAMPFQTAAGERYDSGEFQRVLELALSEAGWTDVATRKRAARERGALLGIGMCYYIEATMGDPSETAMIRFEPAGTVAVQVGTQTNGQGHETAYAQILHERLAVPFDAVRIVQGDTDLIPRGGGTGGSRSVTAQGAAICRAAEVIIERGRKLASLVLEAAADDIHFDAGSFHVVGTDLGIDIMALADEARGRHDLPDELTEGLDGAATIDLVAWTYPNGCHIAEVEVDEDTGVVSLVRYTVVDDFGKVINPLLLEGQVHGGIVQGAGQALLEQTVYDEHGQLLTGSFMDYAIPRASDMPMFDFSTIEVACENNPLGMKGAGEAGTVGSKAAVMNAVTDALTSAGAARIDMPATPFRVWEMLQAARAT